MGPIPAWHLLACLSLATCRAQPNLMGDLTARVGWAYDQFNHRLVYIKGGAAYVHSRVDLATNATSNFVTNGVAQAPLTTSSSFAKVGWTVGVGVEHAIAPAWSVKLEYDYAGFGGETVATHQASVQPVPGVNGYNLKSPSSTTRVTQNFQEASLGLNYKLGQTLRLCGGRHHRIFPPKRNVILVVSGWGVDVGVRDWYSSGRFQKDLGSTTNPASANILNSRLTYNTTANSVELFGRIEPPQNVFVKGNIGAGSLLNGQLNDEDWAIFGDIPGHATAYSNTTSSVKGEIAYATVDLGYDFFRGAGYKLGAFVGYNYFKENKSAYGCTQIANQLSDCVPSIDNSVLPSQRMIHGIPCGSVSAVTSWRPIPRQARGRRCLFALRAIQWN